MRKMIGRFIDLLELRKRWFFSVRIGVLAIQYFFLITHLNAATKYVWSGASGDWSTATNWTPNGIPINGDTAVIGTPVTVTLTSPATVSGFSVTGTGITINLNTNTLTVASSALVSGISATNDVVFSNGKIDVTGTGATFRWATFGSNLTSDRVDISASNITNNVASNFSDFEIKKSHFYGDVFFSIQHTALMTYTTSGGNTYEGKYTMETYQQLNGGVNLDNVEGSTYNGVASFFAKGLAAGINISLSGPIVFNDSVKLYNESASAASSISISPSSASTITFNGPVYAYIAAGGGLLGKFILINYIPGTTCFLNDNISLDCNVGSGKVSIGRVGAPVMLAAGKVISTGALGFTAGELSLYEVTQAGSTVQNIDLTGTALVVINASIFQGECNVSSPRVEIFSSTFNASANITATSGPPGSISGNTFNSISNFFYNGSVDFPCFTNVYNDTAKITNNGTLTISAYNNTFNGQSKIINTGTGSVQIDNIANSNSIFNNPCILSAVSGDIFLNDVTSSTTTFNDHVTVEGSGTVHLAYKGKTVFGGDLLINSVSRTQSGEAAISGASNRIVEFSGGNFQTITSTSATPEPYFKRISINKTPGTDLKLEMPININGKLTFVNGNLDLNENRLTIADNATSSIAGGSATSYLKSETEKGILRWDIGSGFGSYTIPFGYYDASASSSFYLPLTYLITTAGASALGDTGRIEVSTLHTDPLPTSNNIPLPETANDTVTQIFNYGIDNSNYLVDRYWIVDTAGFSTSPTADLVMPYVNPEIAGSNTITPNNLRAQRWINSTKKWEAPTGVVNTGASQVTLANASYGVWVLVDTTSKLDCPFPPILTPDDQAFCFGSPAVVSAVDANSASTSYKWSPSTFLNNTTGASVVFQPPHPNTYTLSLIALDDPNSCFDTTLVTITLFSLPTVIATDNTSICPGETAHLSSQASGSVNYNYDWQPTTGLDFPTQQDVNSTLLVPGIQNYTLIVTDENSCLDTAISTVFVYSPPSVISPSDVSTCAGDIVLLNNTGDPNYNYVWQPAINLSASTGSDVTYSAIAEGSETYSITITDANHCETHEEVNILVLSGIHAEAGIDTSICLGNTIKLQGSSDGGTFSWAPSAYVDDSASSSPTASITSSTQFTLTATLGSCKNTDTVTITVNPLPNVQIVQNNISIFKGQALQIDAIGALDYLWSPDTYLSTVSGQSVTIVPTGEGLLTYIVTGTDTNLCSSTAEITITIIAPLCEDIFVPSAFSPNGDSNNDQLVFGVKNFCADEFSEFEFKLFDKWGKQVFATNDINEKWDGKKHNEILANGVYFYYLYAKGSNNTVISNQGNITLAQ